MKASNGLLVLIALLLAGARSTAGQSLKPNTIGVGDHKQLLNFDGQERSYLIHVPTSCDKGKPCPVVLVFHGGGSNAAQWMPFCGMNETAHQHGFIAVYPNGTGKKIDNHEIFGWNGGPRRPGGDTPEQLKIDDVGFTRAVLDDLARIASVDHKRVFACGMSMGGIMAYRLASELSDRIAAIASIAGPMGTETCHAKRPVSVMHIHGTEDQAVPFVGGKGPLDPSGAEFLSVDFTIRTWVKINACDEQPVTQKLPDKEDDGTTAIQKVYGHGNEGAEVVLIVIQGGGHTWPGREFGPELKVLGKSSKDVAANELIWAFFQKHPMK